MKSLSLLSLGIAALALGTAAVSAQAQTAPTPLVQWKLDGDYTTVSGVQGLTAGARGGAAFTASAPVAVGAKQSLDLTNPAKADYATFIEVNGVKTAFAEGFRNFTVTLWFNLKDAPQNNDRLISWLSSDNSSGFDLRLSETASKTISAETFRLAFSANGFSGQGKTVTSPAVSVAGNTWLFVAATYNSTTGRVEFYMGSDGKGLAAIGSGRLAPAERMLAANAHLWIGATPLTTRDRTPPAYISDVRLFDSTLDIAALSAVSGLAPAR